jgi:hypothetical protein
MNFEEGKEKGREISEKNRMGLRMCDQLVSNYYIITREMS